MHNGVMMHVVMLLLSQIHFDVKNSNVLMVDERGNHCVLADLVRRLARLAACCSLLSLS